MKKLLVIAFLMIGTMAFAKPLSYFFDVDAIEAPDVIWKDMGKNAKGLQRIACYDRSLKVIYLTPGLADDSALLHEYAHHYINVVKPDLMGYEEESLCYMVEAINIFLDDKDVGGVTYNGIGTFDRKKFKEYKQIFKMIFQQ